jgi:LPS sulfotransferase NodH
MMPKTLFLLAEPRSGSSWLMETLNAHPEIGLLGEILNRAQFPQIASIPVRADEGFPDWLAYIEGCLGEKRRYRGCKILLNQLTLVGEGFADALFDRYRAADFILLRRDNLVAAEISLQLAHKSGVWHVKDPGKVALRKTAIPPGVLVANLDRTLRRREAVARSLEARGLRKHSLCYEDLFEAPRRALSAVFAFLDLEDTGPRFSAEVKGNLFRAEDVLENYPEIRERLEKRPEYLRMLLEA